MALISSPWTPPPALWERSPADHVPRRQGRLERADPKGLWDDFPESGSWELESSPEVDRGEGGNHTHGARYCALGLIGDL